MRNIAIVGVGRLGGAVAIALARKGYEVGTLVIRNEKGLGHVLEHIGTAPRVTQFADSAPIEADIVIIATQDGEIAGAAESLANRLGGSPVVLHTSGSLSSEVLGVLRRHGCPAGSMHPLASVSEPLAGAERFDGAYFCVEGDPEALTAANQIVRDLGGTPFSVSTDKKALYHASAVTACGHLVALIDTAFEMLEKCGLEGVTAKQVLLPLIESTISNLKTQTTARALTGTFARGDVRTFERHLAAMAGNVTPEVRDIYLQLGERSLHLAIEQGAGAAAIEELRGKILLAKSNPRC